MTGVGLGTFSSGSDYSSTGSDSGKDIWGNHSSSSSSSFSTSTTLLGVGLTSVLQSSSSY